MSSPTLCRDKDLMQSFEINTDQFLLSCQLGIPMLRAFLWACTLTYYWGASADTRLKSQEFITN
jgi:hypothetical protein